MNSKPSGGNEKKKENFVLRKVKSSVIVRALLKFSSAIYNAVFSSFIFAAFSSHRKAEKKFDESVITAPLRGSSKNVERTKDLKNKFAKSIEQSAILNFMRNSKSFLMRISLSSYGVLVFSFGFYVILVYAIKRFAITSYEAKTSALVVGICAVPVSLFLFSSKKSVSKALISSYIVRTVIYKFLGVRPEETEASANEEPLQYVGIPFVAGMALGVLSFFADPVWIVCGAALLIALFVIFTSPETGLIAAFLLLPFLQTTHLVALVALVAVSFFVKFMCGRRVVKFTVLDIFVTLFMIMTLSGGIFSVSASSIKSALVYACFILGYFLAKQMLCSQRSARRAMCAVAVACAVVSAVGIIEYFIGSPSSIWQDNTLFADIRGRAVSTFANPNVLGEYLILSIPVICAMAITSKNAKERFAFIVSATLGLSCLVLTWSRGAWLGLIAATIAVLLIASRKWLVAAILGIPTAAALFSYASGNFISRLTSITNFSDSSTAYRINIWKSTLTMLKDTFFYGIGIGSGAFETVFPYYALPGLIHVQHSHSLYLQILAETGVFSLLIFVAVLFLSAQRSLSFVRSAASKTNRTIALGIFCALLAFLIQGFTDFVFYNYRITLLFWMFLGLSAAHISASEDSSEEKSLLR